MTCCTQSRTFCVVVLVPGRRNNIRKCTGRNEHFVLTARLPLTGLKLRNILRVVSGRGRCRAFTTPPHLPKPPRPRPAPAPPPSDQYAHQTNPHTPAGASPLIQCTSPHCTWCTRRVPATPSTPHPPDQPKRDNPFAPTHFIALQHGYGYRSPAYPLPRSRLHCCDVF